MCKLICYQKFSPKSDYFSKLYDTSNCIFFNFTVGYKAFFWNILEDFHRPNLVVDVNCNGLINTVLPAYELMKKR